MRQWLVGAILLAIVIAATLSEIFLFRMFHPENASEGIIAAAWVALPYLVAAVLVGLVRRSQATLIVLLCCLLTASAIGIPILNNVATQQVALEQDARDAEQPGNKARNGWEGFSLFFGGIFAIAAVLILVPVQVAAILFPTVIAYGVAYAQRSWEAKRLSKSPPSNAFNPTESAIW